MDDVYAIKTLKRVHDAAIQADEDAAPTVVEQYNEAVDLIQSEYEDNPPVQNIDKITSKVYTPITPTDRAYITEANALEKVKLKTEQIADALELGEGFERPSAEDEMQRIVIQQNASQQQEVTQEVTVESVMELIDLDPQAQANREELEEIVRQFEEELEGDTDPNTLRQFVNDAKGYSTSVAAKLAMMALQNGAVDILGLE